MSSQTVPLIVARPATDNVGIVMADVAIGDVLDAGDSAVVATTDIPSAHKVSLRPIAAGDVVVKYGQVIGEATEPIESGAHVHVHNVGLLDLSTRGGSTTGSGARFESATDLSMRSFDGYRRSDGRAATRNYLGIVPTVNCSSTVSKLIAQAASAAYAGAPGLDGIVPLPHDQGCALAEHTQGDDVLRRTLHGYATHPNFAGVLVVSLGCEVNQPENFLPTELPGVTRLTIQQLGGTAATVAEGVRQIGAMVEQLAELSREPIPIAELTLGLQCGGSDAYSGLTANPTLGVAADMLVAAGGRVILGETPEIFGAEHLLRSRAASAAIAERLDERIAWWLEYTEANGAVLDNNPSKGNRAGGITTIWEKSLGAVLKGGTSPLNDVVDYAAPVTAPGLTFMDTPGYDPVSATGMVAGGATVLAFTTGRGSVFGSRPVPCLKVTTTSGLYRRMEGDMDFDAGSAFGHDRQLELGAELFESIIEMASGRPSKSEQLGFGTEEIVPWRIGAVL
ncbi:altronate dehydratase [Diaminobutyricibacter tongyongensis]|uniref:Altronate dehydratase n=1 Tax=Leifsonia tongyongensis TaxID=1268043 RepID=A0A6L9XV47_9MICO|nr:altronate dehydratase family protein [Diaminobutyricibacter tongyongensis]NEN05302.1 altronate dehydratase [Diaminobutyricibacter tongyongensis]